MDAKIIGRSINARKAECSSCACRYCNNPTLVFESGTLGLECRAKIKPPVDIAGYGMKCSFRGGERCKNYITACSSFRYCYANSDTFN